MVNKYNLGNTQAAVVHIVVNILYLVSNIYVNVYYICRFMDYHPTIDMLELGFTFEK